MEVDIRYGNVLTIKVGVKGAEGDSARSGEMNAESDTKSGNRAAIIVFINSSR